MSDFKTLIEKVNASRASDIGTSKAVPQFRSMYASKSRGEMKNEFEQVASEGAQLPTELLLLAIKSLSFYSKKEFDRVCFMDHGTCSETYGEDARDILNQIRSRLESESK